MSVNLLIEALNALPVVDRVQYADLTPDKVETTGTTNCKALTCYPTGMSFSAGVNGYFVVELYHPPEFFEDVENHAGVVALVETTIATHYSGSESTQ